MSESNSRLTHRLDIATALGLLTRLPLPATAWDAGRTPANAAWAYPLAGLVVATLAGCLAWGLLAMGLPANLAAVVGLSVLVMSTGAMHEDGLADCADGFWGGWTPARRLEIMKDSHIGAYGVAALILVFGLRGAALAELFETGAVFAPLIVAAMASRAAMAGVMGAVSNARDGGLSRKTGRPEFATVAFGCALSCVVSVLLLGLAGLFACLGAALAALCVAILALRKIGGQTGDVLGCTQLVSEIAALTVILAAI